jgi:uncharacterized membrane protein
MEKERIAVKLEDIFSRLKRKNRIISMIYISLLAIIIFISLSVILRVITITVNDSTNLIALIGAIGTVLAAIVAVKLEEDDSNQF